ncbi:unnamed protein product [Sphagnum troendelagicum]|uniref:protein-serine/threonine phosphatase n=1 Tax=Sphagnum troendelagicum TaxID=128251 RepID=A0ABP0TF04_9BRYO
MGCVHGKTAASVRLDEVVENSAINKGLEDEFEVHPATSDSDDSIRDVLGLPVRVPSRCLPASGCRVVKVPAGGYELRYSSLTQRGYYPEAPDKVNQDSSCVHMGFGGNPSHHFFGVFDGHGEFGAHCSQFAKKHLCENLLRSSHFPSDMLQAYNSSFVSTNMQLHQFNIDDSMSGTTAVTVLVRGRTLYVANVGDSRAVIAEWKGKNLVAVDLSSDQTPFRTDECARVKSCGARVLTLDQLEGLKDPHIQCWGREDDDDGDPPRLWVANGMYPGTAFTRSIGDSTAEQIGVIAVPEVLVMELTAKHPFFVLASDGVFEFLSSQAVVDMVAKSSDPKDACAAIVAESYRLWLQYETRTDDITIIVVHIDGLEDVQIGSPDLHKCHSMQTAGVVKSPLRKVQEAWKYGQPPFHKQSRAHSRAIEASLEQDEPWVPPQSLHSKTPADEAQIKQAMQGNFLFQSLTEKQLNTLCECMELVEVNAGDIVIRQGSGGDLFYIVESGQFEVLMGSVATHGLGTVVHCYDSNSARCFGELALMYGKPGQATVRAVTDGCLWVLEKGAFHGVLVMNQVHRPSLKKFRSMEIFSKLSLSHLHNLVDALTDVTFADGEIIVRKDEVLSAFYIVNKGHVDVTYHENSDTVYIQEFQLPRASSEFAVKRCKLAVSDDCGEDEPDFRSFGEWVLLKEPGPPMTAVAVGDVQCWTITRKRFEETVGSLRSIMMEDQHHTDKMSLLRKVQLAEVDEHAFEKITPNDLDWQETVYVTDYCEVGVVLCKKSGDVISMKRYQRRKVQRLGRENQVLLERALFENLRPSPYVPHLLATPISSDSVALVLNCVLAGPLDIVLHSPLDEDSTRFLAASVVLAIELLHKDGVVYHGISPDILMLDRKGQVKLADFRFAEQMSDEQSFSICGMADFLAPEIIKGQGHGLASDWWAVGVLVYFMLQNELPFGSWQDSELDTFGRIARRQLDFPTNWSAEVVDLIDKFLIVDPKKRLGCGNQGITAIKGHSWFDSTDWDALLEGGVEVPSEIIRRLEYSLDVHPTDDTYQVFDLRPDEDDPPWLEGW